MMPETYQKIQEQQKKRQRKFVIGLIVVAVLMVVTMWFSKERHQRLMWGDDYVVEEVTHNEVEK